MNWRNAPFNLVTLGLALGAALWWPEAAEANKFQTIGGGVAGMEAEKVRLLKMVSRYLGGFLLLLGAALVLTRNRFEGLTGYARGNSAGVALRGAAVLAVLGVLLLILSLL